MKSKKQHDWISFCGPTVNTEGRERKKREREKKERTDAVTAVLGALDWNGEKSEIKSI